MTEIAKKPASKPSKKIPKAQIGAIQLLQERREEQPPAQESSFIPEDCPVFVHLMRNGPMPTARISADMQMTYGAVIVALNEGVKHGAVSIAANGDWCVSAHLRPRDEWTQPTKGPRIGTASMKTVYAKAEDFMSTPRAGATDAFTIPSPFLLARAGT